jgi:hypothetical protein
MWRALLVAPLVVVGCSGDDPMTSASGSGSSSTAATDGSSTTEGSATASAGTSTSGASASGGSSTTTATSDATASASATATTGTSETGTSTGGETTGESTGVSASDSDSTTSTTTDSGGECVNDDDCPASGACWQASCDGGACGEAPAPAGTDCDANGGVLCDGEGGCVECLSNDDCPTMLCQVGQCAPASCGDGIKNGDEADVDCGGQCPDKCDDGQSCGGGDDCESGVCTNNVCMAPSCFDGLQNGDETDVDCGGSCQQKCDDGQSCDAPGDCVGGICSQGTCASPSCSDGIKNGSETDVDCGGGCPDKCENGEGCGQASDCVSDYCDGGTCADEPGAACLSAQPDPETGQKCPLFAPCVNSSDCGTSQGCQLWFCNNQKTCELDAIGGCGMTEGGGCVADVVIEHYYKPPVAKRFVPPDGVNFREVASIAFTVKNNTADDLFLDEIPLALDVMNGASKFDVSSTKLFEDLAQNGEHEPGSFFLCVTDKPFQFPANGLMSNCANLNQSKVPKFGEEHFIINLAFAKELGYIDGRSYRLRIASSSGFGFKVGSVFGPDFVGSKCGVPGGGFIGSWVTAEAYP